MFVELTPDLVKQRLDAHGPCRHLDVQREFTTPELLRLLRHRLSDRVYWVSQQTGLSEAKVRKVLRSLLAAWPSRPEGFE